MQTYSSKLVILRGNSASGKSTVAKRLRESSDRHIAIVEQDYLRRIVLKEKESDGGNNIGLIEQTVEYALAHQYDVILEGILYFPRYGEMLKRLIEKCPDHHVYYFDVSFDETLRRHATKPVAHEYGEKELREWYVAQQVTGFEGECMISEKLDLDQIVEIIINNAGL